MILSSVRSPLVGWFTTRTVRTCPRARCARTQREWMAEIQNFHMIWISDTTIDDFHWFSVTLDSWLLRYKLFSVITQPWRYPGAILCFDVIIDIFISVYHKLTKFNTHKLQVIRQHTDNPCPRAHHDAHVRARQNFNMLKITYKQFWARTRSFRAFPNFPSVRVRARVVRARSANEWQKFKIFTWFGFLIQQLTISIDFQSLLTFHKAVRARQSLKSARAAMGNIMQKLAKTFHFWNWNSSRTNLKIKFLYHGWKEHELEIRFHTTLTRTKWNKVIILASKLEKFIFLMTSFLSLFNWDYPAYR